MSKCALDVTYYPFDAQQCELKFASWSRDISRMNITMTKVERETILAMYSPSDVFELKKIFARGNKMPDPCCERTFSDVTFYIVIWRRPTFFLFNYIQPVVLINILALFVFLLPAESGEKITLGISTMLNMTVFLMTVMSGLPPTDETPILSIYFAITMILTTAATVLGVIVLRIHHQGRRGVPVPIYLRTMAKWMAVLTWSKYPSVENQLESINSGSFRCSEKDPYCYNIREYDNMVNTGSPSSALSELLRTQNALNSGSNGKLMKNGKPVFSPRVGLKRRAKLYRKDRNQKKTVVRSTKEFTKIIGLSSSDEEKKVESSSPSSFSSDQVPSLKKKVYKDISEGCSANCQNGGWKDLLTKIMIEKWKSEERKEIVGEEWRKISRILDRFLLILFTILSLINTIFCIFKSPHFPEIDQPNIESRASNQDIHQHMQ
ncbi:neuronal acetylcholine receptor subunit alpha-7 [Eurytemora carolleeae]|uniref:neuronal acetylcholine receptor subunit alpha-7 n=1 Tax=Eurytemora carolleeae TaxID=1294199 RepID=UPI000C7748AB|nr:neuronal acetylcholine receptor subunit alpha-7 [Eurytemora carolleeae]|eukprot:XP_023332575.1 neuronal acetylcholine receptor subunit alpha-7-like [Eurytemora affinis]